MKILVPIKRVIHPYAKVKPLADGTGMDTANIKFDINPFDEIAMEEAVRLKEADPSITITAVGIGGAECDEQLRKALAMGADDAIRIDLSDEIDSSVVAAELAALAQELSPDLILMGKQSTDSDRGQAAQMLAVKLDWPQASFISKIAVDGGMVNVTRETDEGEEQLQAPLPCVVTADLRLNEPRYIALPGIIKARSKPLAVRPRMTDAQSKTRITHLAPPPERPPGRMVGSIDELVAALKERGIA
jgi:electron transfer flavoprotein beta subunit